MVIRNNFFKNVFTVASGTLIAQIISLACSPILTRLYGAEQYGLLGIFLSITMIIVPIGALQLPTAIVLPENNKDIYPILKYSILIGIINAILLLLTISFFGSEILEAFNMDINISLLFFLPLYLIFSVLFDILKQYSIRKEQFKIKAYVDVQQSFIYNSGNVIFGIIHPYAISLIFMSVVNRFFHFLTMLLKLKNQTFKEIFHKIFIQHHDFKEFYKKYYDFVIFRSPQVLLNGISESMPVILLGIYFGPAVSGYYIISKKVLEAPVILIGNAVGDVFYPKINKAFNKGEDTFYLLFKSNIYLALIGFIPFFILFIISPSLFGFVFGEDWTISGEYTRWLSIFLFFFFITRTTIKVMPVYRIQGFHLKFTLISTILRILVLTIGGVLLEDDIMTIKAYSLVAAALYLYLLIHTLIISKTKTRRTI